MESVDAGARNRSWAWMVPFGLAVLFLLVDAIGKVLGVPQVVAGTVSLGYPASAVVWIGLVELACLALYVIPRTSFLGLVLLTGYLGGAVATHVRLQNPWFSHVLFPVYVAAALWAASYLRHQGLRTLVGFRSLPPSVPAAPR